eukprot:scaffold2728_cov110-Cylindrotheca_fusiformis.AAC.1
MTIRIFVPRTDRSRRGPFVIDPISNNHTIANKKVPLNGYGIRFEFQNGRALMKFPTENQDHPDDGEVLLLEDCHFHDKTMTFHANYSFPPPYYVPQPNQYTYSQLECMLQFSRDGEFVQDGYLRWKLTNTDSGEYPLDGVWQVLYTFGYSMAIQVQNHRFVAQGFWYEIEMDENHCPRFLWPDLSGAPRVVQQSSPGFKVVATAVWPDVGGATRVVQKSTLTIPPGSKGPNVGEVMEWTTSYRKFETIRWKRMSMDLSDVYKLVRMNPQDLVYRQFDPDEVGY